MTFRSFLICVLLLSIPSIIFCQYTSIPDPIFEQELIDQNIDSEGTLDGQILTSDVSSVTVLVINNVGINNMTGIEDFVSLFVLSCYGNNFTSLDLSNMSNLSNLNARSNSLINLDLSSNSNLSFVDVQQNDLVSITLGTHNNLTTFNAQFNDIVSLDFSGCVNLETLNCRINDLTSLNISNCTNLQTVECQSNSLTSLVLPTSNTLEFLNCAGNDISTLNLSSLPALKELNCSGNNLTNLDASNLIGLEILNCSSNNIVSLDVTGLSNLESLICIANQMATIDITGAPALIELNCMDNQLQELDLSSGINLIDINVRDNNLLSLDIKNGNNINITNFDAQINSDLCCITVDDPIWAAANLINVDAGVDFDLSCPICLPTKILSGTVEHPGGAIQYSRMMVYDEESYELFFNGNVCISNSSFSIELPSGNYSVYYRPYVVGAQSFEAINVNLTADLDTVFVLDPYVDENSIDSSYQNKIFTFGGPSGSFYSVVEIDNAFSFDSIHLFSEYGAIEYNGLSIGKIALFDDGQGNDDLAGDNIFTSKDVSFVGDVYARGGALSTAYPAFFQTHNSTGRKQTRSLHDTSMGVVNPSATVIEPFISINDSVRINDYLINIVSDDIYQSYNTYTQTLYNCFLDTFDFVNLFTPEIFGSGGFHVDVKVNYSGTGQPIFDNTSFYGSDGKLLGVNNFQSNNYQPPLNHEVVHQWGAYMNELFNSADFGSHWGYSSVDGILGGVSPGITVINSNTVSWTTTATYGWASDQREYADLELYAMGVLDTNDLRDEYIVVTDPVSIGNDEYNVSSISYISPQDIVAEYGYRSPAPVDTVPIFRTATIIVTTEPLSDAGSMFYTYIAKGWEESQGDSYMSFDEATQFRADMVTKLPAAKYGCTDPSAHNYASFADVDDGSCETCSDGILNGDETAIDCGGSFCELCTVLGSNCPNSLNLDPVGIMTGLYKASNVINSDNTISSNLDVKYQAGQTITLSPGFFTPDNTAFEAEIKNCVPD